MNKEISIFEEIAILEQKRDDLISELENIENESKADKIKEIKKIDAEIEEIITTIPIIDNVTSSLMNCLRTTEKDLLEKYKNSRFTGLEIVSTSPEYNFDENREGFSVKLKTVIELKKV